MELRPLHDRILIKRLDEEESRQGSIIIPDTAKDPRGTPVGDEVWVLATIPRKGPPRPIALGIKKAGTADIQRLDLE